MTGTPPVEIRRLGPPDAAAYRALMLDSYAADPDAFTATVDEREPLPLSWWRARVSDAASPPEVVFSAVADDRLVGAAGLKFGSRPRTRHSAAIVGVAVRPSFRCCGVGRALIEAALEYARAAPEIVVVGISVLEPNAPARRLYEAAGFRAFGTEPFAVADGPGFVSVVHLWCSVDPRSC